MATTPLDKRVLKAMLPFMDNKENFGNASSDHFYGQQARFAIEEAAKKVADLLNGDPAGLIWTSGATESINLAIKGASLFYQRQGKHLITLATEHKAVLACFEALESLGFEVTYLKPDQEGVVALETIEKALRDDTILLSIAAVNSEIGVIQNIEEIAKLTSKRGIIFHVDGAQSVGNLATDLKKNKIDLLSFSAHKFYGPKGIGALYVRTSPRLHLAPQMQGLSYLSPFRAGTLPTHQIVGLAKALEIAIAERDQEKKRLANFKKIFWQQIKNLPGVKLNGSLEKSIPHLLNVSFANVDGELLISALKDLAVSSGSACSTKSIEPSHVLKAMGLNDDLARSSIRFSFGRFTTKKEIEFALKQIAAVLEKIL